jgi:anthranilate synthase/aminodeoxychorismate synthase-like glutamine amidotransferase
MIVVIDNYDSFTYNLVQYLGELGAELQVVRNDQATTADVLAMAPDKIIISPGPCTPNEAGISLDVITTLGESIPILGVCLCHQAIGQAYGGKVIRAPYVMHGKIAPVRHSGSDPLFKDVPSPFDATRYHSLIVDRESLPEALEVTADTEDGIIMAMKHRQFPVWGVQFHPESILTGQGKKILGNFLKSGT